MIRVKICGLTQAKHAEQAITAGADALGFVFYEKSKRYLAPEAANWLRTLPAFVTRVGLFVDADLPFILRVYERLSLDLVQLHGDESPDFARALNAHGVRYIRAVPMRTLVTVDEVLAYCARYEAACGFLLDNYGKSVMGGSGEAFSWKILPELTKQIALTDINAPLIIAGGLNPDNVADLLQTYQPYAVDVSSGVESSAGIKDLAKMLAFIQAVKHAQ